MTVAHELSTRFPTTENTADVTTGDRTFTHVGTGSTKGVCLVLCAQTFGTSPVTGILYGGVAMANPVSAIDTTESGRVDIWELITGVPTGSVTVTLQGCAAPAKFVTCNTMTADGAAARNVFTGNALSDQVSANPQDSLPLGTDMCMSYGGIHSGAAAPSASPLAGCTLQNNRDYGALAAQTLRRTNVESGTVVLGVTLASDDWCMASIAYTDTGGAAAAEIPILVMAPKRAA